MHWLKSLTALIDRQLPHALVSANNPVFDHELRNSWQHLSVQGVKRLSLSRLLSYYRWFAVAWVVILLIALVVTRDLTTALNAHFAIITSLAIILSLICTLSDFDYIRATNDAIERYRLSGFWDLLRVTPLGEGNILMGVYAAALMRSWWAMLLEVTMRMIAVTALMLSVLLVFLFPTRSIYDSSPDPVPLIVDACFLVIALGVYILEPLWRMRAFAALGLCISAYRIDPIFAGLAQFGGVIVAHLTWLVIFLMPVVTTVNLIRSTTGNSVSSLNDAIIRLGAALVGAGVTFAFYQALQAASLLLADRLAFRSE